MSFCPPDSISQDPICLSPALLRPILARDFLTTADAVRSGTVPSGWKGRYELFTRCGERLIKAYRFGLIPDSLPELRNLIDWHTQPEPQTPLDGRAQYCRCPNNLFFDVVGGHLVAVMNGPEAIVAGDVITVKNEPQGLRELTDEHGRPVLSGGLMARIDPDYLNLPESERIAKTCEFLAAVIEHTVSLDPPNGTQQGEGEKPAAATEHAPRYVTLDQMAALVNRSKRTLEKLMSRDRNPLPDPDIQGGGGKPNEWKWDRIRPWLEAEYGRDLSAIFSGGGR